MPCEGHNLLWDCHAPFEEDRQICSHTWPDEKGPVVMPYTRYQGHWEALALALLSPKLKSTLKQWKHSSKSPSFQRHLNCNPSVSLGSPEAPALLVPGVWHRVHLESCSDNHSFAFLLRGAILLAFWAQSRLSLVFFIRESLLVLLLSGLRPLCPVLGTMGVLLSVSPEADHY